MYIHVYNPSKMCKRTVKLVLAHKLFSRPFCLSTHFKTVGVKVNKRAEHSLTNLYIYHLTLHVYALSLKTKETTCIFKN